MTTTTTTTGRIRQPRPRTRFSFAQLIQPRTGQIVAEWLRGVTLRRPRRWSAEWAARFPAASRAVPGPDWCLVIDLDDPAGTRGAVYVVATAEAEAQLGGQP